MARYQLNYTVSIEDPALQYLKVTLTIPSINTQTLDFFKGKLRLTSFVCSVPYEEYNDRYTLILTAPSLTLSYTVALGYGGKHGLQGGITPDLLCFSGDQIFLFPIDLLVTQNLAPSTAVDNVQIHINHEEVSTFILPFEPISEKPGALACLAPAWHHSYELMKSPYVAGNLKAHPTDPSLDALKIYTSQVSHMDQVTRHNIERLYCYYAQLFDAPAHVLTLILLDSTPQRLGGCGAHLICASFNAQNPRDWQLLAHRMFHSFMDTQLPLSEFHMPTQLWLTEGLATYYENVALDCLTDALKISLGLDSNKEFCRLFTRYLYSRLKPGSPFGFAPMSEKHIRSIGLLEFLHYTHAPLVIKYIQDHYCTSQQDLLTALKAAVRHHTFSIEDFFTSLLGKDLDSFAHHFLFGNVLLPMWDLQVPEILTLEALIEDLNYFEYLLYSWLAHEQPGYYQTLIPQTLLEVPYAASQGSLSHLGDTGSQALRSYSPALYHLMYQCFYATPTNRS